MNTGWLTPEDVARVVGHTPRTIQRWCRERRIPHIRIGRLYRFSPEQIEQIESAYGVEPIQHVPAATAPNPEYTRTAVVVPMRRPAA